MDAASFMIIIWHDNLPHISISKASSDICYTCQSTGMALQKSIALSEEEKAKLLETVQRHLTRAKAEREYYKHQVEAAAAI